MSEAASRRHSGFEVAVATANVLAVALELVAREERPKPTIHAFQAGSRTPKNLGLMHKPGNQVPASRTAPNVECHLVGSVEGGQATFTCFQRLR